MLDSPRSGLPQLITRLALIASDGAPPRPLRETLRGLGYVEGQNIVYEARFAEGKVERLPDMVAELIRLKVDVLVAQGAR